MTITISRRQAMAGALLAVPAVSAFAGNAAAAGSSALERRLAALEARHEGRIGVAILNLATGVRLGHRTDERFLMCSTFKALLAGHILARVDRKEEALDRRVVVTKSDLVDWSPDRGALIVTAFCEMPGISGDERNAVIAEIGRIAVEV